MSNIEHSFREAADGRGAALARRSFLAATGSVVLAGSLAGNAAAALAAGTDAKPKLMTRRVCARRSTSSSPRNSSA